MSDEQVQTSEQAGESVWQVDTTNHNPNSASTGPSWYPTFAEGSLKRINEAGTPERATAQATAEAVMVLHSIRRILIWTAVIIPLIACAVWVTMIVVADTAQSERCVSIYSC